MVELRAQNQHLLGINSELAAGQEELSKELKAVDFLRYGRPCVNVTPDAHPQCLYVTIDVTVRCLVHVLCSQGAVRTVSKARQPCLANRRHMIAL